MSSTATSSSLTQFTGSYWNALSISNIVFDWLLSLDQEVALIWDPQGRRAHATILYAMTRYGTIAQYAFPVLPFESYPQLSDSCDAIMTMQIVFTLIPNIAVAIFSALRVYALSNRNRPISFVVLVLSITPRIMDSASAPAQRTYGAAHSYALPQVVNGMGTHADNWATPASCIDRSPWAAEVNFKFTIAARGCAIFADLLVVLVTWRHARATVRMSKGVIGTTLGHVLLYDGSLYFVVLATFNIIRIVLSAYEFTVPLSNDQLASIIVSRFILNLRAVHRNSATVTSTVSCLRFQPQAGSVSDDGMLASLAASFSGLMCEEVDVAEEEFTNPVEVGDVPPE